MRAILVSCCAVASLAIGASMVSALPGRDPGLRSSGTIESPVGQARRKRHCHTTCKTRMGKRRCVRRCWEVQSSCPPDC